MLGEIEKVKDMTVNDLLKLMALHDKVTIIGYGNGDMYYEGLVKDVDNYTRSLTPRLIGAAPDGYIGEDAFITIEVDD